MAAERNEDPLLRQLLSETEEAATTSLFIDLCHSSPPLRRWLWSEFARDESTRAGFAARLKRSGDVAPRRVAELAEADAGRAAELAQLKQRVSARIYGGRTWSEIESIVAQLRAGRADLGAFLLALQWRRAGKTAHRSAVLLRAAAAYVDAVLRGGQRTRLAQLGTALDLVLAGSAPETRRTSVAFGDWWKLQLLLHILRNPSTSYRTRELHAYLSSLGLRIDPREIRRFCTRHGIARDVRGGRPKLPPAARKRPPRC